MAFDDKTDEELKEELRSWDKQLRAARAMVTAITTELLERHKKELEGGGFYTDYGFVPNHKP